METMTNAVPVYRQHEHYEYNRLANELGEHDLTPFHPQPAILVSAIHSRTPMGTQHYGTRVSLVANRHTLRSVWVPCKSVYEPESRNQIGDMGAYRDVPDEEGIAAAIRELSAGVAAPAVAYEPTLSLAQAAGSLKLNAGSLRIQCERGKLRATRIETERGPVWRVTVAEVERYRQENKGKPGRKPGKE